jgi:tetratricopeptide (TPR) repeat protein
VRIGWQLAAGSWRTAVALAVTLCASAQPSAGRQPPAASQVCDRVVWEITHGQYARALTHLEGAPTTGGSEASRANLRGLTHMLAGDVKASLADFDTALELDPAMAEARFNRAVAMLRLGDYMRASKEFESLWSDSRSPLRARVAYHDALALDALQRPKDAEAWLARALEADPQLDDALFFSGVLRERAGDMQAAGHAYKTYLDRHPQSVGAMLRFGICAQRAGSIDTAKAFLQRVAATAPDSPEGAEARKFLVMWE